MICTNNRSGSKLAQALSVWLLLVVLLCGACGGEAQVTATSGGVSSTSTGGALNEACGGAVCDGGEAGAAQMPSYPRMCDHAGLLGGFHIEPNPPGCPGDPCGSVCDPCDGVVGPCERVSEHYRCSYDPFSNEQLGSLCIPTAD